MENNTKTEPDEVVDQSTELDVDKSTITSPVEQVDSKQKLSSKKFLIIVVSIMILGLIAFVGYTLLMTKDDSSEQTAATLQTQPDDQNDSMLSEIYESDSLDIKLMHPAEWKVTEGTRALKLESPAFTYSTLEEGEVEGIFRLVIKKGASTDDGKIIGNGYAIEPSEKITYLDPARDQRADTWLTSFGLSKPDNFGFFIVQGGFELKKSDTLGPNFAKEVDAYLIFGGFTSEEKTSDLDTNTLAIDQFEQYDQYKQALEIIKSLKLN
jgi:hypothetical protein